MKVLGRLGRENRSSRDDTPKDWEEKAHWSGSKIGNCCNPFKTRVSSLSTAHMSLKNRRWLERS